VADGVVERIAAECVPAQERGRAHVVELGAGLGALTLHLARAAARVVAVERDRDLVPILRELVEPRGNVEVLEADAKEIDVARLFGDAIGPRVLCGNLPYQITGQLLERAVAQAEGVDRAVFMIQREVADRLIAAPGTKAYGALTVFVQAAFEVRRALTVGRGAFHPRPDVDSAVVTMVPRRPRRAAETPAFREVVKRAFSARRKTLRNAWSGLAPAAELVELGRACGIALEARGETLSVDDFARAAAFLEARVG
jgi:16S rRNA (adenine1518-N6/adenine1519-N6)-dimethyltransferase